MTLADCQLVRITKTSLISICFILLMVIASSFLVFNAYAQQSGATNGGFATGGAGQINQGTGMTITCNTNNACVFTENSATGGAATGGNANNNSPSRNLLN